jgi:hypothetical protein
MSARQFPYNVPVPCEYGAPMGRRDITDDKEPRRLTIRLVPFVDGDYDRGGAYWGGGRDVPRLWCAWSPAREVVRYIRAKSLAAALLVLFEDYPATKIKTPRV